MKVRNGIVACLLALLLSWVPMGRAQNTQLALSVGLSADQGLGYNLPVVPFSIGLTHQFGSHFELFGYGDYQISHKAVIDNGHTVNVGIQPVIWINRHFGVTGEIEASHLWTSAYSKGTFLPTLGVPSTYLPSLASLTTEPGIVFAGKLVLPSRFYFSGLIPTNFINQKSGIESNDMSGVQFSWVAQQVAHLGPFSFHQSVNVAVYHGYSQGNPQCDGTNGGVITCPRQSWITPAIGLTFTFVFPRDGKDWTR